MSRREKVLKKFLEYDKETSERVRLGVEQNRKGFINVTVKDKDGNRVPNARIEVKLKKHEFLYGANLFMLDELESPKKNELYNEYHAAKEKDKELGTIHHNVQQILHGAPSKRKDQEQEH